MRIYVCVYGKTSTSVVYKVTGTIESADMARIEVSVCDEKRTLNRVVENMLKTGTSVL
jgi:hypothetical protein